MADLNSPPKPHSENIVEIADFTEIECLKRADRNVSVVDVVRIMQRGGDDHGSDDSTTETVQQAFSELECRVRHCGPGDGRYPFELANAKQLLRAQPRPANPPHLAHVYLYLLLATRMNMKSERNQGGEDGTALFEHLCSEVAKRHWGGPSEQVCSIVFGTGRQVEGMQDEEEVDKRGFSVAVNNLCKELGEGNKFHAADDSRVTARDGKLDLVVWRRFADRRGGQLIGFGQCKTGSHWESDLWKLSPQGFCEKWMLKTPAVIPVRLYFVADRVTGRWYDRCKDGGILFDRCRIMEHADKLPETLMKRVNAWVGAALKAKGLAFP